MKKYLLILFSTSVSYSLMNRYSTELLKFRVSFPNFFRFSRTEIVLSFLYRMENNIIQQEYHYNLRLRIVNIIAAIWRTIMTDDRMVKNMFRILTHLIIIDRRRWSFWTLSKCFLVIGLFYWLNWNFTCWVILYGQTVFWFLR